MESMKSYIIKWDCGCGPMYEEILAASEDEAQKAAYEAWREDAESQADYGVLGEATEELREDYL